MFLQFNSVTQLSLNLCDPMDCSRSGLPVHHQLPESIKLMPIESAMPSNHLILCHPLLLPSSFAASESFQMSQHFASQGQSIGLSSSASVLLSNIQDWFPYVDYAVRQKDNTSHLHNQKFPKTQRATWHPSFTVSLEIFCVISTSSVTPACLTCSGAARGEWKSWLKAQHSKN